MPLRGEEFAGPIPKPERGSLILERRRKRAVIESYEKGQKAKVVKRDGEHSCRLVPRCPERTKHETAHVEDKGMGGDHSNRSSSANMIRSCLWHHRGNWSLHSGDIWVVSLTERGCDGPVEIWANGKDGPYLLKREIDCNVTERD